jgi:sec-independent protein translocase protein TatA
MFSQIGPMEIILVLVIALIVLGPKRLPEAGRSLGKGVREFKDSVTGAANDVRIVDVQQTPPQTTATGSEHEPQAPSQGAP